MLYFTNRRATVERSLDVDEPYDLEMARALMAYRTGRYFANEEEDSTKSIEIA